MKLGRKIKIIRVTEGVSTNALAVHCGVSQACISQIESSRSLPSVATLKNISDSLGVEYQVLTKLLSKELKERVDNRIAGDSING